MPYLKVWHMPSMIVFALTMELVMSNTGICWGSFGSQVTRRRNSVSIAQRLYPNDMLFFPVSGLPTRPPSKLRGKGYRRQTVGAVPSRGAPPDWTAKFFQPKSGSVGAVATPGRIAHTQYLSCL